MAGPGEGGNRTGRRGKNVIVPVPVGTLIYDDESGRFAQRPRRGRAASLCRSRRDAADAATPTTCHRRTKRRASGSPASPAVSARCGLELKLIADVGLVGLPNAGKSTLLSRLTRARPKIADYPFTTLDPQLGILELPGYRRLVIADIPGLIEGAHTGVGLGDAFLKHVERTRVLVHLLDLCPDPSAPTPVEAYHTIRRELEQYSPTLAQRREIVVGNKMDLTDADVALEMVRDELGP